MDPAFQGAGLNPGIEIWAIEKLGLVPIPKSSHGKFHSGSAYIVLNTTLLKSGIPQHDIYYWLGAAANEVDSAFASDKAIDLDAYLGSRSVQYREVQGSESEKFLSYFRPCIIPLDGIFSSGQGDTRDNSYTISMLACQGDRVVHVKEVQFSRTSLNHDDVFIIDTASKIFLFCGCNSTTQERAKSLEVVQYVKDSKHGGKCEVAIIEDGKLVGDSDVGEFWSLFGGYVPIARDSPSTARVHLDSPISSAKLFWINAQGVLCQCGTHTFEKGILSANKCYMLDCYTEIYVWMGRNTSLTERKASISATEDFLKSNGRSAGTHLTLVTDGSETPAFKSYFSNWPKKIELKLYEEGREKVAAMFKQRGYDVTELPEEHYQSFIDCSGEVKVWRVNAGELLCIPVDVQNKFFSGDCYIVQYTYLCDTKEELFYAWIGRKSITEDRVDAISHMGTLASSTKGQPVEAQVHESMEPLQFFSILKTLIVFKGGISKTYKNFIEEKNITDDTYSQKSTALFRVQGFDPYNMQVVQVDHVSSSLNSSYCYILQNGTTIYTWTGSLSSPRDHDLLDRALDLIDPTWQPLSVREGNEPDVFWNILGKKVEYPKEKVFLGYTEDPNLFACRTVGEDLKFKEIFNFTQDDLTTEDVLVLNCHNEIYVWIGRHSNATSNLHAFKICSKFLDEDIPAEGLSTEIPIYLVKEGYEPPFFTRFFQWDSSKTITHGNSFERKLSILKGKSNSPSGYSQKRYSRDIAPDSLRSSIGSDGSLKKVSSTPMTSDSNSKSKLNRRFSSPAPVVRKLFSESSLQDGSAALQPSFSVANETVLYSDNIETGAELVIYPYERVKVLSSDPLAGIDITKREAYLSKEEFEEKFGMEKEAFYKLPKWKQNKLKTALQLF